MGETEPVVVGYVLLPLAWIAGVLGTLAQTGDAVTHDLIYGTAGFIVGLVWGVALTMHRRGQ